MAILQSAAGYGGLAATPLSEPGYSSQVLARVYERDFLPEITNSDIDQDITHCHQRVNILRAPEVGPWRPYQKNQEMVPNQVSTDAVCLEICNAAYNAIKMDQTDIHFACTRWDQWENLFLDAAYEALVKMLRNWVLTSMILETAPTNKGSAAGKYGNIDLGTKDNPVVVDKDNIPLRVAQLQLAITEQLRWKAGEMFLIVPPAFRSVLSMSNYANAAWAGSCKPCSLAIDGMWEAPIGGFNIIESVSIPPVIDKDGNVCYYVIAGNKNAFAYVADILSGRVVELERAFAVEYQMLTVWGGKMLYPNAMAIGYWTFKNE